MYNKETEYDFSMEEYEALEFLIDFEYLNVDYSDETGISKIYRKSDNILLLTETRDDQFFKYNINEELTVDDNIKYIFNEEEKRDIQEHQSVISKYDGLEINLVNNECNDVCIIKATVEDKTEDAMILSSAKINDLSVDVEVSLKTINEYIKYKIMLENKTDEDLPLDNEINNKYINYEFEYEDNDKNIKANSTKTIYVTIKYSNQIPKDKFNNGKYIETSPMTIYVGDIKKESNPNTSDIILIVTILLSISVIVLIAAKKPIKYKKIYILSLLTILLPAIIVYAANSKKIIINSKVEIPKPINITYDPNNDNATGQMSNSTGYYGDYISISNNNFEVDNLVFVGWSTNKDGSGITYNSNSFIELEDDITLYAVWTPYIYWALQDNDNNGTNETLLFSTEELSGNYSGRISPQVTFHDKNSVPWHGSNQLSVDVTTVNVEKEIRPVAITNWFDGISQNAQTFTADLGKLNTSQITYFAWLFNDTAKNATSFIINGLDKWDTSKVTTMKCMFQNAGNKASTWNIGDLSNWNTSNVTEMDFMFSLTGTKTDLYTIKGIKNWDVSKVKTIECLFQGIARFGKEINLDLSNWNLESVTKMGGMFWTAGEKTSIMKVNLSNWNMPKMTSFERLFESFGDTNSGAPEKVILDVSNWKMPNVTNMEYLFFNLGMHANETSILGLETWDVSNVTNMYGLFCYVGTYSSSVNIGNIKNWDVSNVTNFGSMFVYYGFSLQEVNLDLNNWNIKSAIDLSRMFQGVGHNGGNVNINVKNWNTTNVKNMTGVFDAVGNMATGSVKVDISNWNMSNVETIDSFAAYPPVYSTSFSFIIPRSNANGINNTTTTIYGKSSNINFSLGSTSKRFTLS